MRHWIALYLKGCFVFCGYLKITSFKLSILHTYSLICFIGNLTSIKKGRRGLLMKKKKYIFVSLKEKPH